MARGRIRVINREKTHCKRGHLLSGDNLYLWKNHRHCKACKRLQELKRSKLASPA
jgi:hypothetical protein